MSHTGRRAFYSAVQEAHEHDGYDYFDLAANLSLPGVPKSLAGVSGGGLWQIKLSMTKSGTISGMGNGTFAVSHSGNRRNQMVVQ